MDPSRFRSLLLTLAASSVCAALSASPAAAQFPPDDCGIPLGSGDEPTSRDALYVLKASVGSEECSLCVCDVDDSGEITATDALTVLRRAVGLNATLDCPLECANTTTTLQPTTTLPPTTTTLPPIDSECPGVAQFALFANVRAGSCTTNGDCAAFSYCDTEISRCRTRTENDIGWNGLAHDQDINDPIPARIFLDCGEGKEAPCGQCEVTGHDPSLGNCRCANDNREVCFTVADVDEEDCGGERCECYFGPPMPLSAGNTPVCVLNSLNEQPGGLVNVDEGSGTIDLPLREVIYIGQNLFTPCPICINDTTPADRNRDGTCVGGRNDGESCDAQDYNAHFPPPTGALYSLDCFPLENADISSGGLLLDIHLTTGQTTLTADLPCAQEGPLADLDCHCLVCSGNAQIGCDSDAVCAEAGAGTCSSNGGGEQPLPNACSDGVCVDSGNNEGVCQTGPDDTWCDGLTRGDGTGLIGCATNVDCQASTIGLDAGNCTLVERRDCFLETIVSQGQAHPVVPFAADTYCSPATTSDTVNIAAGLPGPGRLALQSLVSLFCESDPTQTYTPGVGNCP